MPLQIGERSTLALAEGLPPVRLGDRRLYWLEPA